MTIILLPDSGPLITLAYAGALDLLLAPRWKVGIVDMVLHEVTRSATPTSQAIASWLQANATTHFRTNVYEQHMQDITNNVTPLRKAHLGEQAVQEVMLTTSLIRPAPPTCVFMFEEYRIAKAQFVVPTNARKVSTRAFLIYLEGQGLLSSAVAIERKAIDAGRAFSQIKFP